MSRSRFVELFTNEQHKNVLNNVRMCYVCWENTEISAKLFLETFQWCSLVCILFRHNFGQCARHGVYRKENLCTYFIFWNLKIYIPTYSVGLYKHIKWLFVLFIIISDYSLFTSNLHICDSRGLVSGYI